MRLPLKLIGEDYAHYIMRLYKPTNIDDVRYIDAWLGRMPNAEDRIRTERFFYLWNNLNNNRFNIMNLNSTQQRRISMYAQNVARELRNRIFMETTYEDWGY